MPIWYMYKDIFEYLCLFIKSLFLSKIIHKMKHPDIWSPTIVCFLSNVKRHDYHAVLTRSIGMEQSTLQLKLAKLSKIKVQIKMCLYIERMCIYEIEDIIRNTGMTFFFWVGGKQHCFSPILENFYNFQFFQIIERSTYISGRQEFISLNVFIDIIFSNKMLQVMSIWLNLYKERNILIVELSKFS